MGRVGGALSERSLPGGGCEGNDAQIFVWARMALGGTALREVEERCTMLLGTSAPPLGEAT
jgi:hypothetical protein